MGDVNHEPSMEEILASIKRIIAEDGEAAVQAAEKRRPPRGRAAAKPVIDPHDADMPADPAPPAPSATATFSEAIAQPRPREEVLELTDKIDGADDAAASVAPLVSDETASASRSALSALSALIVKPQPLADNTLEGLVREMLRPMLTEWLDANLPELVEGMVAKEIARITGKTF
jgi:cell pole-organizing protein PopZ